MVPMVLVLPCQMTLNDHAAGFDIEAGCTSLSDPDKPIEHLFNYLAEQKRSPSAEQIWPGSMRLLQTQIRLSTWRSEAINLKV